MDEMLDAHLQSPSGPETLSLLKDIPPYMHMMRHVFRSANYTKPGQASITHCKDYRNHHQLERPYIHFFSPYSTSSVFTTPRRPSSFTTTSHWPVSGECAPRIRWTRHWGTCSTIGKTACLR